MNEKFNASVHAVAAEPMTTFLKLKVLDYGRDVAYESAVLGRLRRGYRVFQLRGLLGTRIELCYLLVQISFGSEINLWPSARHLRMQRAMEQQERDMEKLEIKQLQQKNAQLEQENDSLSKRISVSTFSEV